MIGKNIFLNFYGYNVEVETDWPEIADRLSKDFSHFEKKSPIAANLNIQILKKNLSLRDSSQKYTYKSKKVSFYNLGKTRYCNYNELVETFCDFERNKFIVQGQDLHGVHEVAYLLILSRVGKALDQLGAHRLHSVGFIYERTLFVGLFSSGVGKTTLLSNLMERPGFSMVSDDSPLVNRVNVEIQPFPIRLGFNKDSTPPDYFKGKVSYELNRFRYGVKSLYSLRDLDYLIGGPYERVVLLTGIQGPVATHSSSLGLAHAKHMFLEGVIGFGLPILFEYFWEAGSGDFLIKTRITFSRILTFYKLWKKTKKYNVTLSSDDSQNYEMIKELAKS